MTAFTYQNLGKLGYGRLGNQLWQIAWQIGQADLHDGTFHVPPDWEYRKFFSLPPEAYEPPTGEIVDGGAYFYQELDHWEHARQKVWEYFQPSEYARLKLRSNPDYREEDVTSVHFRRGDYLNNPDMFPVPTYAYYKNAMLSLKNSVNTDFLVFTDGYSWVKNLFENDPGKLGSWYAQGRVAIVNGISTPIDPLDRQEEPTDVLDLFEMAYCDSHVIANSSFSWWGAFLGHQDSETFYPSVWWGHKMDRVLDSMGVPITTSYKKAMPDNWIEVPC